MNLFRGLTFFALIIWRESRLPYVVAALLILLAICMSKCSGAEDEYLTATVTAYGPGIQDDGTLVREVTMTGVPTTFRGVAADFSEFPLGTRIFIPGYGWALVDDACGAARQAHRLGGRPLIDIRFPTVDAANEWGRKALRIRVRRP